MAPLVEGAARVWPYRLPQILAAAEEMPRSVQ